MTLEPSTCTTEATYLANNEEPVKTSMDLLKTVLEAQREVAQTRGLSDEFKAEKEKKFIAVKEVVLQTLNDRTSFGLSGDKVDNKGLLWDK